MEFVFRWLSNPLENNNAIITKFLTIVAVVVNVGG